MPPVPSNLSYQTSLWGCMWNGSRNWVNNNGWGALLDSGVVSNLDLSTCLLHHTGNGRLKQLLWETLFPGITWLTVVGGQFWLKEMYWKPQLNFPPINSYHGHGDIFTKGHLYRHTGLKLTWLAEFLFRLRALKTSLGWPFCWLNYIFTWKCNLYLLRGHQYV